MGSARAAIYQSRWAHPERSDYNRDLDRDPAEQQFGTTYPIDRLVVGHNDITYGCNAFWANRWSDGSC